MQDVSSSGAGASAWQGAGATAHAREAEGKPPPPGASPGRVLEILQRLRSIECLVMLAAALTVAALLLHDRLTTRRIEFRAVDSTQRFQPYAYDDSSNGGNSLARVDRTRPLAWDCDLRRGFAWPYCGFGLLFDRNHQGRGVDLSGYTRLRIRLSYEGSAALLRIALKNHDAPHAPLANALDKVNQLSWPLHRHENTIDLPMEDFAVADWWKDQTKAPVALAQPGFGNVVAMEFISGTDAAPGPQRFRIESVSFERQVLSPAGFYGALVGFWIILIAFVLSARQRQLNRIRSSAQLALSESEQLYRTMLDASTDTIVLFDANGRAEFVNSSAVAAMEIDGAASVLGKHWTELWGSGTAAAVADAIRTTVAGQAARCQAFWPTARGTPKWWDVAIVPLYRQGVLKGTLTISRDVTEDRDRAEQLRWASEHDALTQLPNRRAFQMRLQAAALRAMGNGDQLGLLLIDLDHFKHINDTLGHSAGDELMKKIGARLRKGIRHNDFVARVGGDEFALLVQDVPCDQSLLRIGEHLHALIGKLVRVDGREIRAGASIGGALLPGNARSADDLFRSADTALFSLKREGRGGVRLFNSYMLEEAEKSASQLRLARNAVTANTVVPVYQPKFKLHDGSIDGVEALLRWRHPRNGLQLPGTVEEAFAQYELAAKIGELMQRKICDDLRSWLESGAALGRVAINAAPAEFLRDDYGERLMAIIGQHGVAAEYLEIEVTEHAFLGRANDYVVRALKLLKREGMTIALDDFGTGSSSLSHLRDFPVDVVKIDRTFIQQMTSDREISAIVAALVNLAQSLSIKAVAEGVDSRPQFDLLRAMGCHAAQGYLLSEPVEAAGLLDLLSCRRSAA